ncbi:MAG: Superoxide dismutase (Fe) [candidate division WS2 bacterium]|uniref:superoxide dismutase n=1 Tax=Psychracetigena formicireducens TaxID=2986056 RepID=A0A9E2BGG9_PSYF1|nr:Superoxide dismutase (Fe) [Candidatus Psychracetigena formicireducens]MBT9145133.1 Superoxide dismutase (Fe) [Candidatus Psychracetigena formicireducens]MBT9151066.1 Superoxide dismutase (Fe) [Candidatus Psychracetigena formicireducens]
MAIEAKNYEDLLGLEGFSDQLLQNHFTLYQGYLANTNKLDDILKQYLQYGKVAAPEYAELKRRFGWEFNGVRLHEYYFGNLVKGGSELDPKSKLLEKIVIDFGSLENWEKDFRATGVIRGIGWVILYYDSATDRLFNTWVNEHDVGHLSGALPLLVMDVFEHAFMIDYGLKRADYINSFFKSLNWAEVATRFTTCLCCR